MDSLSVIIVAGGSGMRMQSDTPKQFLYVGEKVMLFMTLEAFKDAREIILVLPKEWMGYWKELCEKHNFTLKHKVVEGGGERFYSVANGLKAVREDVEFVAVHDGVRPFVSQNVIKSAIKKAKECGAAVPVVAVTDSIRMVNDNGDSVALQRSQLKAVQTPQVFKKETIVKAYQQPFCTSFTDDASVVEKAGFKIGLSEGDVRNIKVTYKTDL